MKLIKLLDVRMYGGSSTRFGLFFCDCCGTEVEKSLENGKRHKSCGCMQYKRPVIKYGGRPSCLKRKKLKVLRRCLLCNKLFGSVSKGNRICPECGETEEGYVPLIYCVLDGG